MDLVPAHRQIPRAQREAVPSGREDPTAPAVAHGGVLDDGGAAVELDAVAPDSEHAAVGDQNTVRLLRGDACAPAKRRRDVDQMHVLGALEIDQRGLVTHGEDWAVASRPGRLRR